MSDIFISYKREDQATARKLADALESEGWTVWWDPKLRAGERFNDVIETALNEAKCVIVLWSKRSVQSLYVKDEAHHALKRNKLVPVMIEEVELPFRFEDLHTPSLCDWNGSKDFSEFRRLVDDISTILGPSPEEEAKRKAEEANRRHVDLPDISQQELRRLLPGHPEHIYFGMSKNEFEAHKPFKGAWVSTVPGEEPGKATYLAPDILPRGSDGVKFVYSYVFKEGKLVRLNVVPIKFAECLDGDRVRWFVSLFNGRNVQTSRSKDGKMSKITFETGVDTSAIVNILHLTTDSCVIMMDLQ